MANSFNIPKYYGGSSNASLSREMYGESTQWSNAIGSLSISNLNKVTNQNNFGFGKLINDTLNTLFLPITAVESAVGGIGKAIHTGNVGDITSTIGNAISSQYGNNPYQATNALSDIIYGKDTGLDNWNGVSKFFTNLAIDSVATFGLGAAFDAIRATDTVANAISSTKKMMGDTVQNLLNKGVNGNLLESGVGHVLAGVQKTTGATLKVLKWGYGMKKETSEALSDMIKYNRTDRIEMERSAVQASKIRNLVGQRIVSGRANDEDIKLLEDTDTSKDLVEAVKNKQVFSRNSKEGKLLINQVDKAASRRLESQNNNQFSGHFLLRQLLENSISKETANGETKTQHELLLHGQAEDKDVQDIADKLTKPFGVNHTDVLEKGYNPMGKENKSTSIMFKGELVNSLKKLVNSENTGLLDKILKKGMSPEDLETSQKSLYNHPYLQKAIEEKAQAKLAEFFAHGDDKTILEKSMNVYSSKLTDMIEKEMEKKGISNTSDFLAIMEELVKKGETSFETKGLLEEWTKNIEEAGRVRAKQMLHDLGTESIKMPSYVRKAITHSDIKEMVNHFLRTHNITKDTMLRYGADPDKFRYLGYTSHVLTDDYKKFNRIAQKTLGKSTSSRLSEDYGRRFLGSAEDINESLGWTAKEITDCEFLGFDYNILRSVGDFVAKWPAKYMLFNILHTALDNGDIKAVEDLSDEEWNLLDKYDLKPKGMVRVSGDKAQRIAQSLRDIMRELNPKMKEETQKLIDYIYKEGQGVGQGLLMNSQIYRLASMNMEELVGPIAKLMNKTMSLWKQLTLTTFGYPFRIIAGWISNAMLLVNHPIRFIKSFTNNIVKLVKYHKLVGRQLERLAKTSENSVIATSSKYEIDKWYRDNLDNDKERTLWDWGKRMEDTGLIHMDGSGGRFGLDNDKTLARIFGGDKGHYWINNNKGAQILSKFSAWQMKLVNILDDANRVAMHEVAFRDGRMRRKMLGPKPNEEIQLSKIQTRDYAKIKDAYDDRFRANLENANINVLKGKYSDNLARIDQLKTNAAAEDRDLSDGENKLISRYSNENENFLKEIARKNSYLNQVSNLTKERLATNKELGRIQKLKSSLIYKMNDEYSGEEYNKKIEDLSSKEQELNNNINSLKDKISTHETNIINIDKQKEELTTKKDELSNSNRNTRIKLEENKKSLDELNDNIKRFKAEHTFITSNINSKRWMKYSEERIKSELARRKHLSDLYSSYTTEKEKLLAEKEELLKTSKETRDEITKINNNIKELTSSKSSLKGEYISFRKELRETENNKKVISSQKEDMVGNVSMNENSRIKLQELNDSIDKLDNKMGELKSKIIDSKKVNDVRAVDNVELSDVRKQLLEELPQIEQEAIRCAEIAGFNYNKLTAQEMAWAKRWVPFYAFTKCNLAFQLRNFVRGNAMRYATLHHEMNNYQSEALNMTPEQLNSYDLTNLYLPLFKTDGDVLTLKANLPASDLFIFANPTQDPSSLLGRVNPLIQSSYEWLTGKSFSNPSYSGSISQTLVPHVISSVPTMLATFAQLAKGRSVKEMIDAGNTYMSKNSIWYLENPGKNEEYWRYTVLPKMEEYIGEQLGYTGKEALAQGRRVLSKQYNYMLQNHSFKTLKYL